MRWISWNFIWLTHSIAGSPAIRAQNGFAFNHISFGYADTGHIWLSNGFYFASEDDLHDVNISYHATNCRQRMKYKNDSNSMRTRNWFYFNHSFIRLMHWLDYYAVNTYEIISSLFLNVTMCLSGALIFCYCCCTMLSKRKRINRIPNT